MLSRRGLMAMLAAGAIPAKKVRAAVDVPPPVPSGEPEYFVVHWFEGAPVNDFIEGGIYTKEEDAIAHIDRRIAEGRGAAGSCRAGVYFKMTHKQLCHSLAEKRLGPMAQHLNRLMQINPDTAQHDPDAIYAPLYGPNSEYPVAVGRQGELSA